ncbi:MAG TPA: RNA polymerase sigma factor [Thermoanaerobaculia bacterium]
MDPPREHEAGFDRLFERHGGEVHRFFVRKGFSFDAAAELTQETFVRVYQALSEFRGESTARTWIFSIARNLYLNARRHDRAAKRKRTEIPLDDLRTSEEEGAPAAAALPDPSAPDPLDDALRRERRERLWRAVDELPPRMRQCVLLRAGQERSYQEIADLLGVSIDTVKSQLHQAKGKLRELLGEGFNGLDVLGGDG